MGIESHAYMLNEAEIRVTFKKVSLGIIAGVKFMWDMDSTTEWYGCCKWTQESREENVNKPEMKVNYK